MSVAYFDKNTAVFLYKSTFFNHVLTAPLCQQDASILKLHYQSPRWSKHSMMWSWTEINMEKIHYSAFYLYLWCHSILQILDGIFSVPGGHKQSEKIIHVESYSLHTVTYALKEISPIIIMIIMTQYVPFYINSGTYDCPSATGKSAGVMRRKYLSNYTWPKWNSIQKRHF